MQPCSREIRVNRGGGVGNSRAGAPGGTAAHLDCTCMEDEGAARLLNTDLLEFSGTAGSLVSPTCLQPRKNEL